MFQIPRPKVMDTMNTRSGDGFGGLPAYSEYTRFGTNYRSPSSIINGGISEAASQVSSASKKSKLGCWCSYVWIFTLLVLVIISLVVSNLSVYFLMRDGCSSRALSRSSQGTLPGQRGINEVDLGHFFQAATRRPLPPPKPMEYTTPYPRVRNPLDRFTLTLPPGGGRYIPPSAAEGPGIAGIIELEAELAPVTDKNPVKNAEWDLARRLQGSKIENTNKNINRNNKGVEEFDFDLANRGRWNVENRNTGIISVKDQSSDYTDSWNNGGGEWMTFSIAPEDFPRTHTTPPPQKRPQRITTMGRIRKSTTLKKLATTQIPYLDKATARTFTPRKITRNPLDRIEFQPPIQGEQIPVTISVSSVTTEPKTARFLALHTPVFQAIPTGKDSPQETKSTTPAHQRGKRQTERLPGNLIPLNYAITWQPYLDKQDIAPEKLNTFDGNVTITIWCVQPTDKVILNSKDLVIDKTKATLTRLNDDISSNIPILGVAFLEHMEMIALELGEDLIPEKTYSLRINFSGKMGQDRNFGLWYTPYITEKGWER